LMLPLFGLLGRTVIGSRAFLVAAVFEPEKSQDAPNGRGLRTGGLLIEHVDLARHSCRTIIREDGLSFKTLCTEASCAATGFLRRIVSMGDEPSRSSDHTNRKLALACCFRSWWPRKRMWLAHNEDTMTIAAQHTTWAAAPD